MNKKDMDREMASSGMGAPSIFQMPEEARDDVARNYTVKYFKANIDEPADLLTLQLLETKSMAGDEIIATDRQTNFFEGTMYVVFRYLEKRP